MLILVGKFLLERRVQSTDDEVTVVLVLHQLLDATLFQEADASTLQHRRRHVLQELLVVAGSTRNSSFTTLESWSRLVFQTLGLGLLLVFQS